MAIWKAPLIASRPLLIYGGGCMGQRIACIWVAAGYNVNIIEAVPKDRVEAVQYVINNVAAYMKKTGSFRKGSITSSENLEAANIASPWLFIETLPDPLPAPQQVDFKTDLLGDLDAELPDDCIICMNSRAPSGKFLRKVNWPRRVLNLHHYLVPNARVIEMVKNQHTDQAIVEFLFKIIPDTGALPILARHEQSSMIFRRVWCALKQEVLATLGRSFDSRDIDDAWDNTLCCASTEELRKWLDRINRDSDNMIEKSYIVAGNFGRTILGHLVEVYSEEGRLGLATPYDGLEQNAEGLVAKLSTPLKRSGPDIFVIDIGALKKGMIGIPDQGKILCGYTDGTVRALVSNLYLPYGLAIHFASKRIYWSDLAESTITSCSPTGGSIQIIVPRNRAPAPKQLAIDQIASKIYWTQNEGTKILRCNMDGSSIETLLETTNGSKTAKSNPSNWPNGLALDAGRRHFYWSQPCLKNRRKSSIFRASMDMWQGSTPSKREDIETLFTDLPEVLDMDFVPIFDELYWCARSEGPVKQEATNIHRGDVGPDVFGYMKPKDVVVISLNGMGWLKTDPKGGHVYMTSLKGEVARVDMMTGNEPFKVYQNWGMSFAGIALMYPESRPRWIVEKVGNDGDEAGENSSLSLSTESSNFNSDTMQLAAEDKTVVDLEEKVRIHVKDA